MLAPLISPDKYAVAVTQDGCLCRPEFCATVRPAICRNDLIARISREPIMAMYQPGSNDDLQRAAVSAIREHWVLFLVEGIVLVVLGALAIVVPVIATLAFTLLVGWLFLISG